MEEDPSLGYRDVGERVGRGRTWVADNPDPRLRVGSPRLGALTTKGDS